MNYATSRIVQILTDYGQYFSQSNWYTDLLVWLSQIILNLFKTLVDAADALLNSVYNLFDFTSSEMVSNFLKTFNNYLWIPFAMALLLLGYNLIINKEETRPKVVQNILIAVMVICALPNMMLMVSDFTRTATQSVHDMDIGIVEQTSGNLTFSDKIIRDQLTDLRYLNRLDWGGEDKDIPFPRNNISTKSQLNALDWTEKLWSKGSFDGKLESSEKINDSVNGREDKKFLFDYYLKYNDETKQTEAVQIEDHSFLTFLIRSYYRYHIDFVAVLITLTAVALVLFFTAFKTTKLLWELAIHRFLALIFSVSDLNSGQRIKAILKSMASIFMTIFLTAVLLKFFLISSAYINMQNNLNTLVKAFILIFIALACIDAPNILERILGIDAGLKSGFYTAAAAFRGGQSVWRGAKSVGRTVKNAGSGGKDRTSHKENNVHGYKPDGPQGKDGSIYGNAGQKTGTSEKKNAAPTKNQENSRQSTTQNTGEQRTNAQSIYSQEQDSASRTENESLHMSHQEGSQNGSLYSDSNTVQSIDQYQNNTQNTEEKQESRSGNPNSPRQDSTLVQKEEHGGKQTGLSETVEKQKETGHMSGSNSSLYSNLEKAKTPPQTPDKAKQMDQNPPRRDIPPMKTDRNEGLYESDKKEKQPFSSMPSKPEPGSVKGGVTADSKFSKPSIPDSPSSSRPASIERSAAEPGSPKRELGNPAIPSSRETKGQEPQEPKEPKP